MRRVPPQKIELFITTALRISDPSYKIFDVLLLSRQMQGGKATGT
jgi:hypothetical protein